MFHKHMSSSYHLIKLKSAKHSDIFMFMDLFVGLSFVCPSVRPSYCPR